MAEDPNAAEDLGATEDSVAADADELARLEGEKRGLDPADPRVSELSAKAVEVAAHAHRATVTEQKLAAAVRSRKPRRPD